MYKLMKTMCILRRHERTDTRTKPNLGFTPPPPPPPPRLTLYNLLSHSHSFRFAWLQILMAISWTSFNTKRWTLPCFWLFKKKRRKKNRSYPSVGGTTHVLLMRNELHYFFKKWHKNIPECQFDGERKLNYDDVSVHLRLQRQRQRQRRRRWWWFKAFERLKWIIMLKAPP